MKKEKQVFFVSLDSSEHRNVELALWPDKDGRLAELTFYGDGQNITLFMMDADCLTLAKFLKKACKGK